MKITKAYKKDLPYIKKIIILAINHMQSEDNDQWTNVDEIVNEISDYIDKNVFYVVKEDDEIIGCFAMIYGNDDTYNKIIGSWDNNEDYVTIHKIAVKYFNKHIGSFILDYVSKNATINNVYNIRIDTSKLNKSMINLLACNNFIHQGIISIKKDFSNEKSLREAYLKKLKK